MLKKIHFKEILSNRSVHGLVWTAEYEGKTCVVKMLVLKSGKHPPTNSAEFDHNDKIPFRHKEFKKLKPMSKLEFVKECKNYFTLSKLGLAPKMYGYWIHKTKTGIHYGFILNEKLDTSVKEILLKRNLTKQEGQKINKLIDNIHKLGITHGDMKPSNIGCYLDAKGYMSRCFLFDCSKVAYRDELSNYDFDRKKRIDYSKYKKHFIKNTKVDRFKGK